MISLPQRGPWSCFAASKKRAAALLRCLKKRGPRPCFRCLKKEGRGPALRKRE